MFVVFLLTLNSWITPNGLNEVLDLVKWGHRAPSSGPVTFLVTYPFRWLPFNVLPLALNLFSAVCAALTLGLLARSVALLPHDRTYEQRQREQSEFSILSIPAAWLPPVFAVLVCGLQMTFWDNAIEATGEMFDLLLFAYAIRCLLEYRISVREPWMIRFAVVYGLGMADNWAMIGFLPAFVVAVVWIKGLSVLNPRFLVRMICCGLAGFLLIFLLPLLNTFSHASPSGFWEMVRSTLSLDKRIFTTFPREVILVLALTSILPVFVMGVRWASYFGDNSPLGIFIATAMFHIVHALFFIACLWVALDAPVSPRQMGYGLPFLTFYYLGALSVGYFSGYFLLVFGVRKSRHAPHPILRALNLCVTGAVWLLFIAVPALLVAKNLPHVQNGKIINKAFESYFAQIAESLPPRPSVVLSDDTFRTSYAEAMLRRRGRSQHLFIDTTQLEKPDYLKTLEEVNPAYHLSGPWTNIPADAPPALASIQLLDHLSLDHEIYYLHPSFGYFFEKYYAEPHRLICRLKPYPSNEWDAPLTTKEQIADNQSFWQKACDDLSPLIALINKPANPPATNAWLRFLAKAHLKIEPNWLAYPIGGYYSRALDEWGVELQKTGRLGEAGKWFEQAVQLNPSSAAARINQAFNRHLITQTNTFVPVYTNLDATIFSQHNGWTGVLKNEGPIDEPGCRDELATVLARGNNYRQAVQQFDRIKILAPNDARTKLQLAQLLVIVGSYTNAITPLLPWTTCYDLALQNTDEILQTYHDEPNALFLKSVALIQQKSYKQALEPLNRLLSLPKQNENYAAVLNRAIAYYKIGDYKAAKPDYEAVRTAAPKAYQVYYGLGQIADHQNNPQEAIKNYELYLTNAPLNTEEARSVTARLNELRTGAQ